MVTLTVPEYFLTFSLCFIWFLAVTTFSYSLYVCVIKKNRCFKYHFNLIFLAVVVFVYGLLLFGVVPINNNLSAFIARIAGMCMLAIIFAWTFAERQEDK